MSDAAVPPFDESQFASTIVHIEIDGRWIEIVPMREDIASTGGLPFEVPLHVISGCNPGYRESDDVNATRHIYMESRLHELGISPLPAVGMAPDTSWVEPSWAVIGLSREVVCALGRDFGQVAVFEIGEVRMSVVRCTDGEAVSTMPYSVRL